MQEDTYSPSTFATTATITEKERWPAVAFADDVKLPMLRGNTYSPRMESNVLLQGVRSSDHSGIGSDNADTDAPKRASPSVSAIPLPHPTLAPLVPVSDDEDDVSLVVLVVDDNLITRGTMAR